MGQEEEVEEMGKYKKDEITRGRGKAKMRKTCEG